MNAFTKDLLEQLAGSIPYFVMLGVALWVCAKNRVKNPALSKQFSMGFSLLGIQSILGSVNRAWLHMVSLEAPDHGVRTIAIVYGVVSFVLFLVTYLGWGLLILAIHRAFQYQTTDQQAMV